MTRALGLVSTIVLTRILPLDILGLLTLVQTCGQTASSLFRLGSNYSYTVLLPTRRESRSHLFLALSYSRLGVLLSVPFAIVVAAFTALSIWKGDYTYITSILDMSTLLIVLTCIILTECLGELLWSIIFPLKDLMNFVLYRDPLVGLMKLGFPLILVAVWGVRGVLISALAIGCISLLGAMRVGDWFGLRIFISSIYKSRVSDIIELLRFGFAGYIFPLATNLIMLPLLLESTSLGKVSDIGALRIGTWGAQIITVVGGSLAPVLLVKNSRKELGKQAKIKIADLCAALYYVFFSFACISIGFVNDSVFLGKYSEYEQLQLIVIAGAVVQSLVQLLLQHPLRPVQQLRINGALCFSLLIGFLAISNMNPESFLITYSLVPLATNTVFIIILLLSRSLRSDLAVDKLTASYLACVCLSIPMNIAFRGTVAFGLLTMGVGCFALVLIYVRSIRLTVE